MDDSERARRLLEAFKLVVAYDKVADEARIQIKVDARDVDSIRHVITIVVGAPNEARKALVTHKTSRFLRLRGGFEL
jgi:hypothetical protein